MTPEDHVAGYITISTQLLRRSIGAPELSGPRPKPLWRHRLRVRVRTYQYRIRMTVARRIAPWAMYDEDE
jgi:hypothetical protein